MSVDPRSAELPHYVELTRVIRRVADEAGIHTTGSQRKRMAQTLLLQHAARNPAYAKDKTTHADPVPNEVIRRVMAVLAGHTPEPIN